MQKHLWDFVIEDIPCGWEDIYQEALKEYPDGYIVRLEESYEVYERYFYHPVKCYKLLVNRFNEVKQEALHLLESRNELELDAFISGIVKADAELFALLTTWCSNDFDGSSFDPKRFLDGCDFEYYIGKDFFDNQYAQFRIVKPD